MYINCLFYSKAVWIATKMCFKNDFLEYKSAVAGSKNCIGAHCRQGYLKPKKCAKIACKYSKFSQKSSLESLKQAGLSLSWKLAAREWHLSLLRLFACRLRCLFKHLLSVRWGIRIYTLLFAALFFHYFWCHSHPIVCEIALKCLLGVWKLVCIDHALLTKAHLVILVVNLLRHLTLIRCILLLAKTRWRVVSQHVRALLNACKIACWGRWRRGILCHSFGVWT